MKTEIRVDEMRPPIPVRGYEYFAYRDGEDFSEQQERGRIGWGNTPSEAVADLLRLEEER